MKFNTLFTGFALLIFAASPTLAGAKVLTTLSAPDIPQVIENMNTDRRASGLSPLRVDSRLSQAAQKRSQFLAQEGRIYHVTAPEGTPWKEIAETGYSYTYAGENLSLGIEEAGELERRWMESPTHRQNILNGTYQDVGVGITSGSYYGTPASYVVVYFGKQVQARAPQASYVATQVASVPALSAAEPRNDKTARLQTETTQSVVSAGESAPRSVGTDLHREEKIGILQKLIALFDSYLDLVRKNESLT